MLLELPQVQAAVNEGAAAHTQRVFDAVALLRQHGHLGELAAMLRAAPVQWNKRDTLLVVDLRLAQGSPDQKPTAVLRRNMFQPACQSDRGAD